jgi:hypothetical protein
MLRPHYSRMGTYSYMFSYNDIWSLNYQIIWICWSWKTQFAICCSFSLIFFPPVISRVELMEIFTGKTYVTLDVKTFSWNLFGRKTVLLIKNDLYLCITVLHPDTTYWTILSRHCVSVNIPLQEEMFNKLPSALQRGGKVSVTPVLFNIGINEQASLADK